MWFVRMHTLPTSQGSQIVFAKHICKPHIIWWQEWVTKSMKIYALINSCYIWELLNILSYINLCNWCPHLKVFYDFVDILYGFPFKSLTMPTKWVDYILHKLCKKHIKRLIISMAFTIFDYTAICYKVVCVTCIK